MPRVNARDNSRNKFNWKICPRCHLAYIPWKRNQTFCSFLCEMLAEEENGKDVHVMKENAEYPNLDWKIRKVNNIETNPIECWYTIGEFGNLRRFYKIVPVSKCDVTGLCLKNETPYFCLYESLSEEESGAKLVAVYEDLDLAKKRTTFQLFHIDAIGKKYCQN